MNVAQRIQNARSSVFTLLSCAQPITTLVTGIATLNSIATMYIDYIHVLYQLQDSKPVV